MLVHSLDYSVNLWNSLSEIQVESYVLYPYLMSPLGTFALLRIEHDPVLHLKVSELNA